MISRCGEWRTCGVCFTTLKALVRWCHRDTGWNLLNGRHVDPKLSFLRTAISLSRRSEILICYCGKTPSWKSTRTAKICPARLGVSRGGTHVQHSMVDAATVRYSYICALTRTSTHNRIPTCTDRSSRYYRIRSGEWLGAEFSRRHLY